MRFAMHSTSATTGCWRWCAYRVTKRCPAMRCSGRSMPAIYGVTWRRAVRCAMYAAGWTGHRVLLLQVRTSELRHYGSKEAQDRPKGNGRKPMDEIESWEEL